MSTFWKNLPLLIGGHNLLSPGWNRDWSAENWMGQLALRPPSPGSSIPATTSGTVSILGTILKQAINTHHSIAFLFSMMRIWTTYLFKKLYFYGKLAVRITQPWSISKCNAKDKKRFNFLQCWQPLSHLFHQKNKITKRSVHTYYILNM